MSTPEYVNISHTLGHRTAARFAVIQALYQIETTDEVLLEPVLKGFLRHFNSVDLDGMELGEYDQQLFQSILEGISRVASDLDDMIKFLDFDRNGQFSEGFVEKLTHIIGEKNWHHIAFKYL
mgnify:CR=1 FL=1